MQSWKKRERDGVGGGGPRYGGESETAVSDPWLTAYVRNDEPQPTKIIFCVLMAHNSDTL